MQVLLIRAVDVFFQVLYFLILIRIILSWIPMLRSSAIGDIVYNLTEPILGPFREMVDKSPIGGGMMIDFSPIIALFAMSIAKTVLIGVISMF